MSRKLLILFSLILTATHAKASWISSYFEWTNLALGAGYIQNGNYVSQIPYSNSLEELRMNYGSVAMKRVYARLSNDEIKRNNENVKELVKLNIDFDRNLNGFNPLPDSIEYLDQDQLEEIYFAMTSTEVVRNQRKYGGRGVGFCFGRALVAHNHALIRNVHPASIRKIWVVGDMGFWGHHVSTIIKSKDSWVAIDNFTGVMSAEEWIERMRYENKGSKELMFFITRAGRFGHATNSLYNSIDLFNVPTHSMESVASTEAKERLKRNDFYQGFFMDFYELLEEEALVAPKFSQSEAETQRAEAARIARLAQEEAIAARSSIKVGDVSDYELSQETIYCYNTENQKLNCNYQLGSGNSIHETSVTITGNAQYQIQYQPNQKIYSKNIIRKDLEGVSYQITEDSSGFLTKRFVKLVTPQYSSLRPYFKVLSEDTASTQDELSKEIMQIKDVLAKFNPEYQVQAENASPLVRIQNSGSN